MHPAYFLCRGSWSASGRASHYKRPPPNKALEPTARRTSITAECHVRVAAQAGTLSLERQLSGNWLEDRFWPIRGVRECPLRCLMSKQSPDCTVKARQPLSILPV